MRGSARIKSGSEDVTVGGPTVTVVAIQDNEETFETGLEVLGYVALGAAGLGGCGGRQYGGCRFRSDAGVRRKGRRGLQ